MPLILAVNPGHAHNSTLSRLARELQGCEIVGAESCGVAIGAIKKRVPDVLLLPAARARGEADLRAQLRRIPGGVPTLTLPAVEAADPLDLARQIRELLTGAPASPTRPARPTIPTRPTPPTLSPELRAAAAAARSWVRARRGLWSEPLTLSPETAICVTSNEPAEVLIDGARVGDTPYQGRVRLGSHTVTVRSARAERQFPVDAASTPIELQVDFTKA